MNPASSPLQGARFLARRFIAGQPAFVKGMVAFRGIVALSWGLVAALWRIPGAARVIWHQKMAPT